MGIVLRGFEREGVWAVGVFGGRRRLVGRRGRRGGVRRCRGIVGGDFFLGGLGHVLS